MAASGAERIWFYYAKETQVGPLKEAELRQAIADGSLAATDYVYREGFGDWKHLKDVPELASGLKGARAPAVSVTVRGTQRSNGSDKRQGGKRVAIAELVVAHNDAHVATGLISNISVTGVFFQTHDNVFSLNDEVKLTLKEGKGLGKPMHLRGVVVRHSRDATLPGYGLELRGIDEGVRARILDYIKRHQAS